MQSTGETRSCVPYKRMRATRVSHGFHLFRVQGEERVVHPPLMPGHPVVHPLPEVTIWLERLLYVRQ